MLLVSEKFSIYLFCNKDIIKDTAKYLLSVFCVYYMSTICEKFIFLIARKIFNFMFYFVENQNWCNSPVFVCILTCFGQWKTQGHFCLQSIYYCSYHSTYLSV